MRNICLPPIPHADFPQNAAGFEICGEELTDLSALGDKRIKFTPEYYKRGVSGAVDRCLLRKTAAKKLLRAAALLPEGYGLHIFDAWRPMRVQTALYKEYRERVIKTAGRVLSEEEILSRVRSFVSIPSSDPALTPVHVTGGAVDLTLCGPNGEDLPMGTAFDSFSDAAATDYFENKDPCEERDNRRLLYYCMTKAGFTNLCSEWWHYDYGDRFWSGITGRAAIYGAVSVEGG